VAVKRVGASQALHRPLCLRHRVERQRTRPCARRAPVGRFAAVVGPVPRTRGVRAPCDCEDSRHVAHIHGSRTTTCTTRRALSGQSAPRRARAGLTCIAVASLLWHHCCGFSRAVLDAGGAWNVMEGHRGREGADGAGYCFGNGDQRPLSCRGTSGSARAGAGYVPFPSLARPRSDTRVPISSFSSTLLLSLPPRRRL